MSTRKFKINPFDRKKAILNENGLVFARRLFLETNPFYQELYFD